MSDEPKSTDKPDAPAAIATKVASLDAVPEPLRGFYKQIEGDSGSAWYLQTDKVEPAVTALDGLKTRTAEKVERFEAQIADLTARLEAAEAKGAADAPKDDAPPNQVKSLQERVAELEASLKESETALGKYRKDDEDREHEALLNKALDGQKDVRLNEDGRALAVDVGMKRTKVQRDKDGKAIGLAFLDESGEELFGQAGEPVTAGEWLGGVAKDYWKEKAPAGSGSHLGGSGGSSTKRINEMTPAEKRDHRNRVGSERFRKQIASEIESDLAKSDANATRVS